jgi:hypothetical protein
MSGGPTPKKARKAELSVQYVVRTKEEVDDLKERFVRFLKCAEIRDKGTSGDIPIILSKHMEFGLSVNLDPACEVTISDLSNFKQISYGIGEINLRFNDDNLIKVRIGIMGPEEA